MLANIYTVHWIEWGRTYAVPYNNLKDAKELLHSVMRGAGEVPVEVKNNLYNAETALVASEIARCHFEAVNTAAGYSGGISLQRLKVEDSALGEMSYRTALNEALNVCGEEVSKREAQMVVMKRLAEMCANYRSLAHKEGRRFYSYEGEEWPGFQGMKVWKTREEAAAKLPPTATIITGAQAVLLQAERWVQHERWMLDERKKQNERKKENGI